MEPGQRVVRHKGEHVVLHVIVHVPVEVAVDRVHVHRPAVETVIQDILRQTGMLGESIYGHQPRTEKIGETNE